ncbi:glycosyltransferase family 4 protein [Megamonas rupellensis]|uniref:glycosyltransferase family 4 protein n=1 Tax=Megamonas rupellensis TaxID=491921 RepID=UPI00195A7631|nr:glycosyltransferase family 1 protein [Megamonas rupellensis]MBM6748733.1 glycosyltransferase family 4 protein [Megamonas rupellensis]
MKKIYINGRFLTQNITGVQRYAIEIVKALDKYLSDNNLSNKYKFEIVCPKDIRQKLMLKNIEIKQIGILNGHLWEQIELPLYVKNKFLFNFCNCAPVFKQNQVVTIHDAAIAAIPEAYSFLFKTWYKIMFKLLNRNVKCIFTDSNFSKKELKKYFSMNMNKIKVVYCGADHILKIKPDEKIFSNFDIEKNNYVLAVSSLNPSKNFRLILETAKISPEINFVIAGGTNSNIFKEQGLEITSNVKFIGYVNDEELVALYKYASCFIYPSIYEGFGIPPLEAIYFNCPVILSNIDVFKEIYMDNVLYCKINDCNILKEKILLILNDERIKKSINRKEKFLIDKYRWDNIIIELLDIIECK